MRLFGYNIFKREEVVGGAEAAGKAVEAGGNFSDRAVYVGGASSALKVAAVFRAVSLISDSVGSLPLIFKRKDEARGVFVPYEDHPLYYLLTVRPNSRLTAFYFFKNLISQVLLSGNAYVKAVYLRDGSPAELILLSPGTVSYDRWKNVYFVSDLLNGVTGEFSADEILHFKNVSLDGGYTGVSTIHFAAETLGIAATANRETLSRFATGGKVKGILHNDYSVKGFGEYQDEAMEAMATDMQKQLNEGRDIIQLSGDGKFDQLSLSATDMQFIENRKFTIPEIARFFNVPKQKLFDDANANYKSSEMSNIEFYSDCLSPILSMIAGEFAAKLIHRDLAQKLKFAFDIKKLYTTDLTTRITYMKGELESGVKTVNDLRREEDQEPVEGGDRVFVTANVKAIDGEF